MLREREDLGMFVSLRRPSIDTAVVDDERPSLERFQNRPRCCDVRNIQVIALECVVCGWNNRHRSEYTILVDEKTMRGA